MDSADLPRLIYLVILGMALLGWFLAERQESLGKTARGFLVWSLLFVGLMAGYGLWGDIRNEIVPRQTVLEDGAGIAVPRGGDGHFHLTLDVNGVPVRFLVDTGATDIVLTKEDAARVGLELEDLAFLGRARTANGMVATAYTRVDRIELGPYRFDRVGVAVNGGEMDNSLLGMAFLSRFERLEMTRDMLVLEN